MMDEITVTIEVPDRIKQDAQTEADIGNGKLEDHIIDRFNWDWE